MPPQGWDTLESSQRRQEGCKASHFPFKQLGVFMNLNDVKVLLNKKFGEGSAMSLSMNEEPLKVPAICTTGFKGLDSAIGIGGYPKGRIIEIFGPESCLSGDTFIPFEVWSKDGSVRRNHKGGTIRRLYDRFHKTYTDGEKTQGLHLQNNDSLFYVKSTDDEDKIVRNEILDVVKTGIKSCIEISTNDGQIIVTSLDHKFKTPNGFVPAEILKCGDKVFVHNNTRFKGRNYRPSRPTVSVKYHPLAPIKVVNNCIYHRCQISRLVVEAHFNGMDYDDYIIALNTWSKNKIDSLHLLPANIHVHHNDENFLNNNIENLILIDPSEHGKLHALDRIKNLSFIAVPVEIVSIKEVGEVETYDLKCLYPYNNYVADGFVVHNSGKTTLALHACAEVQKVGGHVVYIDAEHALDLRYAKAGVGVDTENMLVCQPDYGEQGIDIAVHALSVNKDDPSTPLLIILDSVDALQPQVMLKGDFDPESDDSKSKQPGQHAKMMSAACRKITAALKDTNATVIFINQIRSKIGVVFGNPETTTGGHALKFYASVRLDIRNIGQYKKGELVIGNHFKVKVRKNKVARPFAEYEGLNLHGYGYQKDWDAFVYLQDKGYITKKGSWQTIESLDLKFQGYNGFVELLQNEENKVVIDDLLALE